MFELTDLSTTNTARIKVIGIGGGGGNAVNTMISYNLQGVDFIVANTDTQALGASTSPIKIQLGSEVTKGLGAGANPEVGRQAATETKDRLQEHLEGADMVFITAGLGGGTGTGGAPVIAEICKDLNVLTVAVVTKPFQFEGKQRMRNAESGINELKQYVDTLVVIPNDRLLEVVARGTSMIEAFRVADDVLRQGIQGISDLIAVPSLINLDFADVKTIMESGGMAHIGIGVGKGENRTSEAAKAAIASPLLETKIDGARALLINITGSEDIGILEINEAARLVQESADSEANIIFGAGIDNTLKDEIHITVIATGFEKSAFPTREPKKKPFKASVPYGSATAAMNPYENRASLEKQEIPAFEAPNVQNFYDSQEASYFPGANRPAPQIPPVAGVPQPQTGASVFQQPYPQVQQVPQYQSAQQPAYSPYQQQQPQQSDKDDLGVPAYLRRSVKK